MATVDPGMERGRPGCVLLDDGVGEPGGVQGQPFGGRDRAALDGVAIGVVECDEPVVRLDVGEVEPRHPGHGGQGVVACAAQVVGQGAQVVGRRRPVEAPDADVDGVDRPPADRGHEQVAGALDLQAAFEGGAIELGERDGVLASEEVRRVQEVDVQGVALDPLAAVEEPAQAPDAFVDLDTERVLHGRARAHLVGDRADAADPGGDVGGLVVAPADEQCLEEPRWLEDLEGDVGDDAVSHLDPQRPLALHPGQPLDGDASPPVTVRHCPGSPDGTPGRPR